MKEFAARVFAAWSHKINQKWINNPVAAQWKTFNYLIKKAKNTQFGKDHAFHQIKNYTDFTQQVPISDYEGLRAYIEKIRAGKSDVLWPGLPLYFAKTSGTTSGIKYIPISKESMPTHIRAARDAILNYIYHSKKAAFVSGKQIFLQGSPVLIKENGIDIGRLSGIVAHYVPGYLQKERMPSWETNCIEDWETKVQMIIEETLKEKMTVIAGIPSWVQMYFEQIVQQTNNTVGKQFPNFSLFIYGGVNYEPYRPIFKKLIGRSVDSIELFPASEGFFAYQDQQDDKGLLLLLNNGIFYEFIEASFFDDKNPIRYSLEQIKLGVNYVMLISTSAGLWGYNLGDTVMFTSLYPFRLKVTGRIKHFISAFGEHVIGSEIEQSLNIAMDKINDSVSVREFTVAPQISPLEGLPYHEWFIEFEKAPEDINQFSSLIDDAMQAHNIYYKDLITGKILRPLVITIVAKEGFISYMKAIGKLGGQNKVARVSNDRKIADALSKFTVVK